MLSRLFKPQMKALMTTQLRTFRPGTINTYKYNPNPVTEDVRAEQASLPVWDRIFDHRKYMHHEGALKLTTGIAFVDVEPFPRMKLMKLYYLAL